MALFTVGLFFLSGLILGSFLNVCIYRLPRKESIVYPASHCPVCQNKIKYRDNIPLFSYIMLRGRCRYCRSKISWQYPVIELLTGILFIALYLKFGLSQELIIALCLSMFLVVISFIDIQYQLILNKVTILGFLLGALLVWQFSLFNWVQILLGFLAGASILIGIAFLGKALFGKDSMGMGDVKMAAMVGVFIGAKGIAVSIFFGFFLAGIFSFSAMAMNKLTRSSAIPFGPFIAAGTFVYVFFGDQIIHWYLRIAGLQ